MKIDKIGNFKINFMYGIVLRTITLFFPFVIRSVMITNLGTQYLGISSLFSSILQTLNLTELGIGSALVFSMYEPIANSNFKKLSAYYNLYKKCYRYIGVIILILGIMLIPFLKFLVNGGYPSEINIYLVYIIYLINTVLSYWFFAYKNSLALAFQRTDIESKAMILTQSLTYTMQIVFLFVTKNYYIYILFLPFASILKNLIVAKKVSKLYPDILPQGNISDKEFQTIVKKVGSVFGHQVAFTVINSVDNIFLSSILGLNEVTIYNNYYYIFSAIVNFMTIYFSSFQAGIGNELIIKKDDIFEEYKKIRFATYFVIEIICICYLNLYHPFMIIWMGKELTLGISTSIIFSFGFFVTQTRRVVNTYKNAAGLWEPDFIKPYIVIAVDIVLDILFIKKYGVNGAMLSTIVSMGLIAIPWESFVLYKNVFKKNYLENLIFNIIELFKTIIIGATIYFIINKLNLDGILGFIIISIITILLGMLLEAIFNIRNENLKWLLCFMKKNCKIIK